MSEQLALQRLDFDLVREEYANRWNRAKDGDSHVERVDTETWRVSFADSDEVHELLLYEDGEDNVGFCDCDGFTFHEGPCSHLIRAKMAAAIRELDLPDPPANVYLGESESPEPQTEQVPEVIDAAQTPTDVRADGAELPERSLTDDPIEWLSSESSEFVDTIDGTPAINRKGFEVLSHFYDVAVETNVEVNPAETDFTYCQVKAVATTEDGRRCEALGSAHVDRGDDSYLLLEMADTRARKRALSIATGVGAVAVAELKTKAEDAA